MANSSTAVVACYDDRCAVPVWKEGVEGVKEGDAGTELVVQSWEG